MLDTIVNPLQMTVGSLFSGMGGFASGFASAGFKVLWANDIDPYACAVFRHRFPGVPLFEKDVRELSAWELKPVDVLAAGFPCQSFSQAGERNGFDDPRGKLFFEIPRIVSEFAPKERPRLIVLENVPHLRVGAGGEWLETVRRELRGAGYWFRGDPRSRRTSSTLRGSAAFFCGAESAASRFMSSARASSPLFASVRDIHLSSTMSGYGQRLIAAMVAAGQLWRETPAPTS